MTSRNELQASGDGKDSRIDENARQFLEDFQAFHLGHFEFLGGTVVSRKDIQD